MTGGDTGTPQAAAAPDSATGQAFDHLATRDAVHLANQSAASPARVRSAISGGASGSGRDLPACASASIRPMSMA